MKKKIVRIVRDNVENKTIWVMGGSRNTYYLYWNMVSIFGIQVILNKMEIFKIVNKYRNKAGSRWYIYAENDKISKPRIFRGNGIGFWKQQVES